MFKASIDFSDQKILGKLFEHWDELHDELLEEFKDHAEEIVTGAKALAPKDEGNLEDTIHIESLEDSGDQFKAVISVGGTATKYAARMHEDTYNPGEITQAKPDYKGYKPGRKYLENSLEANRKEFLERLRKIIKTHGYWRYKRT